MQSKMADFLIYLGNKLLIVQIALETEVALVDGCTGFSTMLEVTQSILLVNIPTQEELVHAALEMGESELQGIPW